MSSDSNAARPRPVGQAGRSPSPDGRTRASGRRTIQSVERALDILECLSRTGGEMKLNEIAGGLGLNTSTCHHLLGTLAERDYVGRNPRGRTYFLGAKITELSSSRVREFNLFDMAMPELKHLNQITEETVHLAVMQGCDLVTLAKIDSPKPVRVGSDAVGKTSAAHATATGKAILAWLPETEIARVIGEKGLQRFTEATLSTLADLVEELRLVRRNGYALDREEFQSGVVCVGSAVRDHTGAVMGSVSCSLPAMRADQARLDEVVAAVRHSAQVLSKHYGQQIEARPNPGEGPRARDEIQEVSRHDHA